jgi:DNA repair exonuclease SbcCD ATPase subunit
MVRMMRRVCQDWRRLAARALPRWTPRAATGRAAAAVMAALLCALSWAGGRAGQDPAVRLELDALLQEGGLLRDELERLRAPSEKLAAEGGQLDAQEQALRAASQALNRDIQAFNAALGDLEKAARAHQARCPRESEDTALVEVCNAEAGEIRAQAQQRDAQGPALKRRQRDLNSGIEQHNAARQDWAARKSKQDALVALNRRDLGAWLERAQRFFETDAFRVAYVAAGRPAACGPEGLEELTAAPGDAALERALDCLQAL